jgi:NAD(P)-dependent dehydrogenase (short-subunit alcohol dehydrogenase family)
MGQAMCKGIAAEGGKVVVSARSSEFIDNVCAEIAKAGGDAIAVPTDVSKADQCQALAQAALDKWGRIDGLVHSAYYHPDWMNLETADIDQIAQSFDVAALGGLRMAQAVIPTMKEQGSGSIVNISTLATRKPMPGEGGYAMSKAAVNQLGRQLAVELGGTGIRVNTALMGWLDGVPLDGFFKSMGAEGEAFRKQRASEIPVGHIPPDSDCAKTIYFLLSDYASEVTGAALDVNGGDWVAP